MARRKQPPTLAAAALDWVRKWLAGALDCGGGKTAALNAHLTPWLPTATVTRNGQTGTRKSSE